jgi:hypothetical protein
MLLGCGELVSAQEVKNDRCGLRTISDISSHRRIVKADSEQLVDLEQFIPGIKACAIQQLITSFASLFTKTEKPGTSD